MLKAYIETHLKTEFIWLSKFSASIHIFFDKMLNKNLNLCIDYQVPNNLIIKS